VFTPVSLYQLVRSDADDFLSKAVGAFDWFLFFLDGGFEYPEGYDRDALVPMLGELGEQHVAVVDFRAPTDSFRQYLYAQWMDHAPGGIVDSSLRAVQHAHEPEVSETERLALERLFYSCLFRGDSFQPSVAIANTRDGWLVRRKLTPEGLPSADQLVGIVESRGDAARVGLSATDAGLLLLDQWESPYTPHSGCDQSLYIAFADYLDAADDVLAALQVGDDDVLTPTGALASLPVRVTRRFAKDLASCAPLIREAAVRTIRRLVEGQIFRRPELKRITLGSGRDFYRLRIDRHYRIHFEGSPKAPVLLSVGSHRLRHLGVDVG
jgi:hypothetical protein